MADTKILVNERNNVMDTVDNARAKWGLGKVGSKVSGGTIAKAEDYNNLTKWLTEAKNASKGSPTAVEGAITQGTVMVQNKITNLISQANAIYNYCKCHGQCTGSCASSCTGSCKTSCSAVCAGACRNRCGGTCGNHCSNNCAGH